MKILETIMKRAFLGICLLSVFVAHASAFAEPQVDRMPEKTVIHSNGTFEILFRTLLSPLSLSQARSQTPTTIPIVTQFANLTFLDGAWAENISENSVGAMLIDMPDLVYLDDNGNWQWGTQSIGIEFCSRVFPPGRRWHFDQYVSTAVQPRMVTPIPAPSRPRTSHYEGRSPVIFVPVSGNVPNGHEFQIGIAVQRLIHRLDLLLSNESPSNVIELPIVFGLQSNPTPGCEVAGSESAYATPSYQNARQAIDGPGDTSTDFVETTLLSYLPFGTLSIDTDSGVQSSSQIYAAKYLAQKLGLGGSTLFAPRTFIDVDCTWDYDGEDGIDATSYDFEYTILHEAFHRLGFSSEAITTRIQRPTLWDLFRLSASYGVSVGAGDFSSAPRFMKAGSATP